MKDAVGASASPPQRTRDLGCADVFVEVLIYFPDAPESVLDERACLAVIRRSLRRLHGAVGGGVALSVLRASSRPAEPWPAGDMLAAPHLHQGLLPGVRGTVLLLRVVRGDLPTLASACAAVASHDGHTCRAAVLRESASLSALAFDGEQAMLALLWDATHAPNA
uniref:Uncharacterized protein n=1 Tax=Chlamydomonas euryale TaxID=1486919 RepID=A0A7R9V492_9CHLO|mmetsp:Transcript_17588/g.52854  ORF Transcript_17588/g.52854 Transcript_17588/m.52854 type:complete len:165 (+) Transcript_17588:132-626(+)